ncbi:MAG: ATP-grasp domain-containing protein [Spirochaetia bacterium]|jgi:hypothetical protein|nr:ATP-grasp domain-containing protein [Spirochaetia bacterium]
MFFADKPYISDFFKSTVKDNNIPMVGTEIAKELELYKGTNIISEEEAIVNVGNSKNPMIYTTSENAIGWISKNLRFTDLPAKIELFKNKFKFRELTKSIYPDLYFKEVQVKDLGNIIFSELPFPFIIKPTVGFFSMGVYKISNFGEWHITIESIKKEINELKNLYPPEVLNTSSFIIEQCIEGDEFAVDAYFNSDGAAVILSILHHTFASDADVSDRVYTTSKKIIEENIEEFTNFVDKIGQLAVVKNFPVHIELRRDSDGTILPIEVNPMRFGGWCTTADITYRAYGFNPYLYYYNQKKPDWPLLLQGKEGKLFSIVVLDNSTGINIEKIESFDHKKLLGTFEKPIEFRVIDFKKYSVFGFLFTETREDNFTELKRILDSDLSEFISLK